MINQLNATTWVEQVKSNPKDEIKVIIGDDKQSNFEPQPKIERWSNEINCSFRLVHNEVSPTVTVEGEKIIWSGEKTEAHFYDIAPNEEHPEGAYEFEVILKEKPLTNKIEFTLETKGLDFFYQPELTQEEIDEGTIRPENVVGSYAVYASENKINYVGGKEYKAGKVGHIFRPKIIDSAGTEVWGELHIENGILSVTIPQEFLDVAVYPIRHAAGLTFGYTVAGATQVGGTSNYLRLVNFGDTPTGTVTSITAYLSSSGTSAAKFALYVVSSLAAEVPLEEVTYSTLDWYTGAKATGGTLSGVAYYLTYFTNDGNALRWFDSATGYTTQKFSTAYTYPNFPDPISPSDSSATTRYSIYATYTAGAPSANYKGFTNLLTTGSG